MANFSDFRDKNTKFTGTIGERISKGTTAERDTGSYGAGTLRFNTTLELLEYYDGVQWKGIDAPPSITSISPSTVATDGSTLFNITVTGTNFSTGCTAKWIGTDNTQYTPSVVTRNSATSLTVKTVATMNVANEPYDLIVTNSSGLAATLADCLDAGSSPAFTAAAGSLGTLNNGNRNASALNSSGTFGPSVDDDSTLIVYSITSGSLPTGLSLGTGANNGKITGTASAVGVDTTSNFTIQASDGLNTASRAYSILVKAPVTTTYTSTGAYNYPVASGVSAVEVLLVAGGGGSAWIGGGGGGGGVVYHPSFPVTPGGTVPGSLGAGGPAAPGSSYSNQSQWDGRGGDTTFGTLTAKGGGSTSGWIYQGPTGGSTYNYSPGGSGGGGTGGDEGGVATQPTTSNPGSTQHGFPGAAGGNHPNSPGTSNGQTGAGTHTGGGGGGAGAAGGHPNQNGPGDTRSIQAAGRFGGNGVTYNTSGSPTVYAGGGAGSSHSSGYNIGSIPGGTGGGGAAPGGTGQSGTTNRGGGAGGGHYPDNNGGAGGPGIVIIRA